MQVLLEHFNKKQFEEYIDVLVELDFGNIITENEGPVCVVYDGTAKIVYTGNCYRCIEYVKLFKKTQGFEPEIMSLEKYKEMIQDLNEAYSLKKKSQN